MFVNDDEKKRIWFGSENVEACKDESHEKATKRAGAGLEHPLALESKGGG